MTGTGTASPDVKPAVLEGTAFLVWGDDTDRWGCFGVDGDFGVASRLFKAGVFAMVCLIVSCGVLDLGGTASAGVDFDGVATGLEAVSGEAILPVEDTVFHGDADAGLDPGATDVLAVACSLIGRCCSWRLRSFCEIFVAVEPDVRLSALDCDCNPMDKFEVREEDACAIISLMPSLVPGNGLGPQGRQGVCGEFGDDDKAGAESSLDNEGVCAGLGRGSRP